MSRSALMNSKLFRKLKILLIKTVIYLQSSFQENHIMKSQCNAAIMQNKRSKPHLCSSCYIANISNSNLIDLFIFILSIDVLLLLREWRWLQNIPLSISFTFLSLPQVKVELSGDWLLARNWPSHGHREKLGTRLICKTMKEGGEWGKLFWKTFLLFSEHHTQTVLSDANKCIFWPIKKVAKWKVCLLNGLSMKMAARVNYLSRKIIQICWGQTNSQKQFSFSCTQSLKQRSEYVR